MSHHPNSFAPERPSRMSLCLVISMCQGASSTEPLVPQGQPGRAKAGVDGVVRAEKQAPGVSTPLGGWATDHTEDTTPPPLPLGPGDLAQATSPPERPRDKDETKSSVCYWGWWWWWWVGVKPFWPLRRVLWAWRIELPGLASRLEHIRLLFQEGRTLLFFSRLVLQGGHE